MDMEILKRLYMACAGEELNYEAGLNLCELYERIEEVGNAEHSFDDEIKATHLPGETLNRIGVVACEANLAYEMQGFINGFRLGLGLGTGAKEGFAA